MRSLSLFEYKLFSGFRHPGSWLHTQLINIIVAYATNIIMTSDVSHRRSFGRYISHAGMKARIYLQKELEPYGIGSGQYHFLLVLYQMDGCSQEELTQKVLVDKATTTRALSKLESLGYITRVRDPVDGRRYIVNLTEKGWELRPKIREVLDRWTSTILEGFTSHEKEQLLDLLERMELNSEGLK